MERTKNRRFRFAALLFLTAALLLVAACAAAEEHHTFVLKCTGGGFVGRPASGTRSEIIAVPETEIETEAKDWTLEELRALPDFRLEGAALRFTATSVQGTDLWYAMTCGTTGCKPQCVRTGRNLWDVTAECMD